MYDENDFEGLIALLSSSDDESECSVKRHKILKCLSGSTDSSDATSFCDSELFVDAPKMKYVFVPKPRILRSDIRRSYSSMLINTMNSLEFSLLFGFLDSYCLPEAKQCVLTYNPITDKPTPMSMIGVSEIAKFWYATMQVSPDAVSSLTDTKVHLYSGTNRSKIVAKFVFDASKMFDVANTQNRIYSDISKVSNDEKHEIIMTDIPYSNGMNNKRKLNSEQSISKSDVLQSKFREITQSFETVTNSLPKLAKPIKFSVHGTIVMFTDENMRITEIIMESLFCSPLKCQDVPSTEQ